jgi:hypothetical protein
MDEFIQTLSNKHGSNNRRVKAQKTMLSAAEDPIEGNTYHVCEMALFEVD